MVTRETARTFTDSGLKRVAAPAAGKTIVWDTDVVGLGLRVTANGARSFLLDYRTRSGRQRQFTIGSFPDWSVRGAREEARRLKRLVDVGGDPLGEVQAARDAPEVKDLIARFLEEHASRQRPRTARNYANIVKLYVTPALGRMKVAEVMFDDIDALHRKVTRAGHPSQANRVVALVSKMFGLAVRWKLRSDNPAKGITRNTEAPRQRYLKADELARLLAALDALEDRQAAAILKLCLYTGCRSGEAMAARWGGIDLVAGTWIKLASQTKQKRTHLSPLSAAAVA